MVNGLVCERPISGRTQSLHVSLFCDRHKKAPTFRLPSLFPSSHFAGKRQGGLWLTDTPRPAPTPVGDSTKAREETAPPTPMKAAPLPGPKVREVGRKRRRRPEERFHFLSSSRADSLDSSFRGTNFILRQTDRPEL